MSSSSATPSSTEPTARPVVRRSSLTRKLATCAAALVVTVLPTACGAAAYAGSTSETDHSGHNGPQNLFPVGGNLPDDEDGDNDNSGGEEPADNESGGGSDDADDGAGEDGGGNDEGADEPDAQPDEPADEPEEPAGDNGGGGDNSGLDVLGTDCTNSDLQPHNGFQEAPRCVDTSFGEVAAEDQSPSLLITESPLTVAAGERFTIAVSTRNLVRDRFLGAAAGGYYLESSFLNEDGIQRGHFHTACRMLATDDEAPDAAPAPEFFLATQDNGGGEAPDTVTVTVTGMPQAGIAQCAVWAGDGSHRVPMMQRANQTPAFDAVRITVE